MTTKTEYNNKKIIVYNNDSSAETTTTFNLPEVTEANVVLKIKATPLYKYTFEFDIKNYQGTSVVFTANIFSTANTTETHYSTSSWQNVYDIITSISAQEQFAQGFSALGHRLLVKKAIQNGNTYNISYNWLGITKIPLLNTIMPRIYETATSTNYTDITDNLYLCSVNKVEVNI